MKWYGYVGFIAAFCIAIYSLPQFIKIIKTKNTTAISVLMFIAMFFGDLFFILYAIGALTDKSVGGWDVRLSIGLPNLVANLMAISICSCILFLKIRNMVWSKKLFISEKEFCENYQKNMTKIIKLKEKKMNKEIDNI